MSLVLWVLAVALIVWGIVTIIQGGLLLGIILIVAGCLIGPGGNWAVSRR